MSHYNYKPLNTLDREAFKLEVQLENLQRLSNKLHRKIFHMKKDGEDITEIKARLNRTNKDIFKVFKEANKAWSSVLENHSVATS